jgi:hypothetical protein
MVLHRRQTVSCSRDEHGDPRCFVVKSGRNCTVKEVTSREQWAPFMHASVMFRSRDVASSVVLCVRFF